MLDFGKTGHRVQSFLLRSRTWFSDVSIKQSGNGRSFEELVQFFGPRHGFDDFMLSDFQWAKPQNRTTFVVIIGLMYPSIYNRTVERCGRFWRGFQSFQGLQKWSTWSMLLPGIGFLWFKSFLSWIVAFGLMLGHHNGFCFLQRPNVVNRQMCIQILFAKANRDYMGQCMNISISILPNCGNWRSISVIGSNVMHFFKILSSLTASCNNV